MVAEQLILNNKIYGEIDGSVLTVRNNQIVFNTINNLRGIGLPIHILMTLRLKEVFRAEFHHEQGDKYIVYKCDLADFAQRFSTFTDNGLKHSFVPLKEMERLVMRDGKSEQKGLSGFIK